jgi:hypothetical protein
VSTQFLCKVAEATNGRVMARLRDGWIHGELPGPGGSMYRVERAPRDDFAFLRLAIPRPNLVLHTPQAPDLKERYRTWLFPPQFGVGDRRIVQLFPVWAQGKATKSQDDCAMQIEITGYSKIARWLPNRHALDPLVALVAFLHKRRLIKTGLSRPTDDWPIVVDHLPAAAFDYYRRQAGLWPSVAGVYGHIELPGENHWDPGGFDYPEFFGMVRNVLGGDEDMRMDEVIKGHQAYREKFKARGADPGPPPEIKSDDFKEGWRQARFAANNPQPVQPQGI